MNAQKSRLRTCYLLNRNSYIKACRRAGYKCKKNLAIALWLSEETIDRWEKNGWPDYAFEMLIDALQIPRSSALELTA